MGVVITRKQAELVRKTHDCIMHTRYKEPDSAKDEYRRGLQIGLEVALDMFGIEYEQWNPLAGLEQGR